MSNRLTGQGDESGRVPFVADLVAVAAVAVATVVVAAASGRFGGPAPLRVPLGFLFVFFVPGYAVTAALFPVRTLRMAGDGASGRTVTVGGLQRLALAVGLSIFLVPLVGLALTLLGQQLTLLSVLGSITAVTLTACVAAGTRRLRYPPHRVWRPELAAKARTGVEYVRADRLNVVLSVVVLLSLAGAGAAIATPESGERYSEFGLLVPDDSGDPVATGYPQELERGTQQTLFVEVGNREATSVSYRVVVLLQEMTGDVDSRAVGREVRLDTFDLRVAADERAVYEHAVIPPVSGENMQLTYLLYRGSVPEDPSMANADESAHLEVDVTAGNGTA